MKLIKESKHINTKVDYYGMKLTVPTNTRFIAADANGGLYSYHARPELQPLFWWGNGMTYIGNVKLEEKWEDTLESV